MSTSLVLESRVPSRECPNYFILLLCFLATIFCLRISNYSILQSRVKSSDCRKEHVTGGIQRVLTTCYSPYYLLYFSDCLAFSMPTFLVLELAGLFYSAVQSLGQIMSLKELLSEYSLLFWLYGLFNHYISCRELVVLFYCGVQIFVQRLCV